MIEDLTNKLDAVAVEATHQKSRPKYQKSSFQAVVETDLFETPIAMLKLLDDFIPYLKDKKVFEPCNGNGAVTNYLKGNFIFSYFSIAISYLSFVINL